MYIGRPRRSCNYELVAHLYRDVIVKDLLQVSHHDC